MNTCADSDEEAAFERKLTKLKTAKGAMPWGESRKDKGGMSCCVSFPVQLGYESPFEFYEYTQPVS